MLHTRHFFLFLFCVISAGLFAASLLPEEKIPLALLPGPTFVSPEEYTLVPAPAFSALKKKDAFVAKVRSRLNSSDKVAIAPKKESVEKEPVPEAPSYPNTTSEALAYEEVTVSNATTTNPAEEKQAPAVATTSALREEMMSEQVPDL